MQIMRLWIWKKNSLKIMTDIIIWFTTDKEPDIWLSFEYDGQPLHISDEDYLNYMNLMHNQFNNLQVRK